MPVLAYLAGQRDPDGHMIIVALDLDAGMEIDVCHFPPALAGSRGCFSSAGIELAPERQGWSDPAASVSDA
jgi:hypothetical protein